MVLVATFLFALFPVKMLYIDPGSGSMLIQILIAGALGAAYAVKTFWHRILFFFRRSETKDQQKKS